MIKKYIYNKKINKIQSTFYSDETNESSSLEADFNNISLNDYPAISYLINKKY